MDRLQKEACVSSMREELEQANLVIVARQVGLTVSEVSDLRSQVRENNAHIKVMKNTLARLAVSETSKEGLKDFLSGPTALAYGTDPVGVSKVLAKFAKANNKLEIVGAILDGSIIDKSAVQALADLPSMDELRAKLIGLISTPATNIARILKEPGTRVARVLNARA